MSKTSKRPRFSVVIPCYNEENYIGDTLSSLKSQDFEGEFEIIVVDNNSTDSSAKIAEEYGVKIVKEIRPGVCWAREAGTKVASGEIVISTDADTIFNPNWLSKLDCMFNRSSNYVAVAGPCVYRSGPFWGKAYPIILFKAAHGYSKLTGHPFYVTATNLAFRKSIWDGYDVHSPQGGDELSMLRQFKKKGKVGFQYSNPVFTSARRLKRGLLYNIFVTLFYYYICGYYIDRVFKRTIIGSAPAYRFNVEEETIGPKPRLRTTLNLFFNKIIE
ncbi:MAG: glycosyltransferase family 2 protein [Candidatus Saccharimonadales bacterium]